MADIKGLPQLLRKLHTLENKLQTKAVKDASTKGAKVVQPVAQSMAPTDTGQLRRNIKVRALKKSRRYKGRTVTSSFRGTDAFYGAFVEYGFTRGSTQIPGKEFMQKAAKQTGDKAISVMVDTLKQGILQAMKQ